MALDLNPRQIVDKLAVSTQSVQNHTRQVSMLIFFEKPDSSGSFILSTIACDSARLTL